MYFTIHGACLLLPGVSLLVQFPGFFSNFSSACKDVRRLQILPSAVKLDVAKCSSMSTCMMQMCRN